MSNKCNVIIIETLKGFSDKIREYLQIKGTSSHVVSKIADVKESLKSLAMPIILAELPNDEHPANKFIDECSNVNKIFQFPLIAIGHNAREYEDQLNRHFKLAICFNHPASNSDIQEALNYITDNFDFPSPNENIIQPPNKRVETRISTIDADLPASEIYSSFHSIPNLFFNELNKYDLLSKDFNGKKYVAFTTVDYVDKSEYLPAEDETLRNFYELAETLPKPLSVKMHRVAFLSIQIIKHLTQDPAIIENAKAAAILFNWSLLREQKGFLKKDYVSLKSRAFRKDLCSKVKDSAMKCAVEIRKTKIAEIISKIAKFIGLEESATDDQNALAASAIAAVDMIDRACWQHNHFNQRAAYKLMVMAKSGGLSELHPIVLCCIIKVLSEALASNIKVFLIPRKLRRDPVLMEAAKKTREQEVQAGERKVEINELTPGMRLSRPLIAFDGREILEQDMVLDQDLIWRIWQLSMVRALNAPLVVEN